MKFISLLVLTLSMVILWSCSQSPVTDAGATNTDGQNAVSQTIQLSQKKLRKKPNVSNGAIADYQPAIAAIEAKQWQKAELGAGLLGALA